MQIINKHLSAAWIPLLLLLVAPTAAQAQFSWSTNGDGTITITGYNGPGGAVTITTIINGRPVAGIDSYAFADNASLARVEIGPAMTFIGSGAFLGCTGLTNIAVDTLNPAYSSIEGVLFNKHQDTLVAYPPGKGGEYLVPNGTIGIGNGAFSGCHALTSAILPSSVADIGVRAFGDCIGLTSVTLPKSVTNIVANFFKFESIGLGSFGHCVNLTNIAVDPLNTTYSSLDGVVYSKSKDTLVTYPPGKGGVYAVPDSVISIGAGAFGECTGLTSVNMGSRVTDLGNLVFWKCTGLTSVAIPDDVTCIGYRAFLGCDALTNVAIGDSVTNIAEEAFSSCGLTSVRIGKTVIRIGYGAFMFCEKLTSVTLPNSLTTIEDDVFGGCRELRSIFFTGNAPKGGDYQFSHAIDAIVYYLPGTTGWTSTFAGLPTALWHPTIRVEPDSVGLRPNGFGFNITGSRDIPIVVEASRTPAGGAWSALQAFTLTSGLASFTDSEWANYPTRFYRIRLP